MYGIWSWVYSERIFPATVTNGNMTFIVQSHTDTWFWLDSHTLLLGRLCDVNVLSAQSNPFGACSNRWPDHHVVFLGGVISWCFIQKMSTLILVIEVYPGNFYNQPFPTCFQMAVIHKIQSSISSNMYYPCYQRVKTECFFWTEPTGIESETFHCLHCILGRERPFCMGRFRQQPGPPSAR